MLQNERQFLALVNALQHQIKSFQLSEKVPTQLELLKCQRYLKECTDQLQSLRNVLSLEQIQSTEKILKGADSFLSKKLISPQLNAAAHVVTSPAKSRYNDLAFDEIPSSLNVSSHDEIALKILEQVDILRKNNLNLQAITQKDLALLDDTGSLVESSVMSMKSHNANVSKFASKSWRRTGIYWMMIFFALLMFFISFMIIKVFPRLY